MDQIDTFFLPYIRQFVPDWRDLSANDIKITKTIGITNKTYIIESTGTPNRIIFRHFGKTGEGLFLNREQELIILETVANHKMGPTYYGNTEQVRIEQYLENKILQQEQMKDPKYFKKVASNLARFHQMEMDQRVDKTPLFERHLQQDSLMLKTVRAKLESPLFDEREKEILKNFKNWFSSEEVQFLYDHLPKDKRDQVFSHNDLLANNILLIPPNDDVVFIDYEYSSFNFRGFDIANYFIESQFNYTNPHPPYFYIENGVVGDEILKQFVHAYAEHSQGVDVDDLFKQLHIGMLLGNFFWAAWALNMAKLNDLDFDYLSFVEVRFHKYYELKSLYFP